MAIPKALEALSPLMAIIGSAMGNGKKGQKKANPQVAQPDSYKRGGKVRKGGMAKVHRGEMKVPAKRRGKRGGGKSR